MENFLHVNWHRRVLCVNLFPCLYMLIFLIPDGRIGVFPDNFVKIIPTSLSEEIITELLNVQISQNGTPYSIGTSKSNKNLDKYQF